MPKKAMQAAHRGWSVLVCIMVTGRLFASLTGHFDSVWQLLSCTQLAGTDISAYVHVGKSSF